MGRVEHRLEGGTANRDLVVRVGDTVRRPQSAGSPAVHALLLHLERVGFAGAPRYLGEDDQGREVLSYVAGESARAPHEDWALTEAALVSVADLLRRYHDAVSTFDPTPYRWSTRVPPGPVPAVVCHNDPNLDNVVFRDGTAVALIDFDLASPGPRLWDVALAARLWVPLRAPEDVDDRRRGNAGPRLRAFVDAYGLTPTDRDRVVEVAGRTHDWCTDIVRAGAERLQPGYVSYWTSTARDRARRGREWFAADATELQRALR